MAAPAVLIAQKNPRVARELAAELQGFFLRVTVAESEPELQRLLSNEVRVIVIDLELAGLDHVRQLARIRGDLTIICTHHAPDEQTWFAALGAGADELCLPTDTRSILRAARLCAQPRLSMSA